MVLLLLCGLFGCGGTGDNATVILEGTEFTVLNIGEATDYKTKKNVISAHFVFTAPEDGVYTVWNRAEEYAYLRFYDDAALAHPAGADCQIHPFIRSLPLKKGESVYLEVNHFSADSGYEGVITVDLYDNAPTPYENYGFPQTIKVGDAVPFGFEYNYSPIVYSFTAPQDGDYLFCTDGDAEPYMNIYADAWCTEYLDNIDHEEIPTEDYYIVEDYNSYTCLELNKDETIYLALAVRSAGVSGNLYVKSADD